MKNLFKKLISVSVSAVMLASAAPCTFAATADGEGGLEPTEQLEYLAHRIPTAVKIYKDSDRTEQILAKDDIPLGEKVYYSLETRRGLLCEIILGKCRLSRQRLFYHVRSRRQL